MGNEESTLAPRAPRNKLSKPRTNTSVNNPILKAPGVRSRRRNSQPEHGAIPSYGFSTMSLDAVNDEAGEKRRRDPRRKRTSIFRSRSTQPKVPPLEIGNAASIENIDCPKEGWSRRSSILETSDDGHHSVPVQM